MIKKTLLITLFILFAGVLIAGGVYRTSAKSANETRQGGQESARALENHEISTARQGRAAAGSPQQGEQQEQRQGQGLGNGGSGQGRNQTAESETGQGYQGQNNSRPANKDVAGPQDGQGYQGGGQGRNQNSERAGEVYEEHESVTFEGIVVQAPSAGVDMIVLTADGQEILVGTGPGYLQEMGFELLEGAAVQVSGFWEEGEFKAETITRDGEMIALRDEFGRPMWSGAARSARGAGNQGNGGNGIGRGPDG